MVIKRNYEDGFPHMFLVSHTKREYTHSSSSISNKTHNYILLFVCFMHTPKRTVMGQKSVASNISIIYLYITDKTTLFLEVFKFVCVNLNNGYHLNSDKLTLFKDAFNGVWAVRSFEKCI